MARQTVTQIELVEDFSATARCDEGFLQLRRLRCRNRHADGTASAVYRVDVVERPRLDAVAVVIYRRSKSGVEVLLRRNLRPAAWFRKDKRPVVADPGAYLFVEELVAGLLEPSDEGVEGVLHRAAQETREEAGIVVGVEALRLLGGAVFLAPGILSEKVFLAAADVTGLVEGPAEGDGSPLEEGASTHWLGLDEALARCRDGRIEDAKTEVGLSRLAASSQ